MSADTVSVCIVTALAHEFLAVTKAFGANEFGASGNLSYRIAHVETRFGGICEVAIVQSPTMGNNAAATLTSRCVSAFPGLQYVLMVGIAGAVPCAENAEKHVRLGDIVVSGERGVVQYDFDKESVDKTEVRSSPRPPASTLLTAVHYLQAMHLEGTSSLDSVIAEVLSALGKDWQRPPGKADVLYEHGEVRPHPRDKRRQKGKPRIFVGTIGSANKLLKNPEKRNLLRDSFDVRAIEMEGSGIADAVWQTEVPGYLVIRGTCDYCDQQKNDDWQKYAAAIAAAYCLEVVRMIPTGERGGGGRKQSTPKGASIDIPPEFDLVGPIGRGASGTVFKVREHMTGTIFALKILHSHLYDDREFRLRFERELRIMARFGEHPHILGAQLRKDLEGRPQILMPYVNGGTLSDKIRSKNMTDEDIIAVAEQLFDAISFLHTHNVVHRDIKPDNILISPDGTIKVTDFGLAGIPDPEELTEAGHPIIVKGSYVAPEIKRGDKASPASDVYSAALVLRAMQLGSPETNGRAADYGMHGEIGAIVRQAASHQPSKRPLAKSILEVIRALRKRHAEESLPRPSLQVQEDPRASQSASLTKELACKLGRDLRESIEQLRPDAALLLRWVPGLRISETETLASAVKRIADWYISVSWHNVLQHLSIADVFRACRTKFWIPRLTMRLQWVGAMSRDGSMMQALGTGILPLRTWVQCLGHPRLETYDEVEFCKFLCRSLGITPSSGRGFCEQAYFEVYYRIQRPWYARQGRPKEAGDTRWLHVPVPAIKKIQNELCRAMMKRVPGHPCSTAFSSQRSPVIHARYHAGAEVAVVVDIRDFFGSVRWKHAYRSMFRASSYWAGVQGAHESPFRHWSQQGLNFLRECLFVTDPSSGVEFLPQGAPTSPVVANSAGALLDQEIEQSLMFKSNPGWTYSRYADDLVISARSGSAEFHQKAESLLVESIRSFGWDVAPQKMRRWTASRGGPLVLCGIVVPERHDARLQLPREMRRRIRAACHSIVQSQAAPDSENSGIRQAVGLVAYAFSVTSDLRLIGFLPSKIHQSLITIAQALPGSTILTKEAFVDGWRR